MRVNRERFWYCLAGAAVCGGIAVWFACSSIWSATVLFLAGAVCLFSLVHQFWSRYQAARLICENPLLNVGIASVAKSDGGRQAERSMNVVVSGFGILMDETPFRFGHDGVQLSMAAIDRESITLRFGSDGQQYAVRLLHGVADKQEIDSFTRRLQYETGITANVSGW